MDQTSFARRATSISLLAPLGCLALAVSVHAQPHQPRWLAAVSIAALGSLLLGLVAGGAGLAAARRAKLRPSAWALFGVGFNGVFLVALISAFVVRARAKSQQIASINAVKMAALDSYLQYDGWVGAADYDWGEIVVANIPTGTPFYQQLRQLGLPDVQVFFIRADNTRSPGEVFVDPSDASFEMDDGTVISGFTSADILNRMAPGAQSRWQDRLAGPFQMLPGESLPGVFAFGPRSLSVDHLAAIDLAINRKPARLKGEILTSVQKQEIAETQARKGRRLPSDEHIVLHKSTMPEKVTSPSPPASASH